jgi:hypothetical protein
MRGRSLSLSALLILGTIAAGLTIRMTHLGLPFVIVKYGGSMLWALMIYWIISSIRPHWSTIQCVVVAGIVASAFELFKLYHGPFLDSFRLTLPGALLLGRVFSGWDLLAYSFAIAVGALADRAIRSRS